MFVLNTQEETQDTFRWPVSFQIATDGGGFAEMTVQLLFKRLSGAAMHRAITASATAAKAGEHDEDWHFLRGIVTGWDEVSNEDGSPAEFTDKNFRQLLGINPFRHQAATAYVYAMNGVALDERKTKN